MKFKHLLLLFGLFFVKFLAAQTPKDLILPIVVTATSNPPKVVLNWVSPAVGDTFLFSRREKDSFVWSTLNGGVSTASGVMSLEDNSVLAGKAYEYFVIQQFGATDPFKVGHAAVAVELPVVEVRGKVLLLVDSQLETPLAAELLRLENDLIGDGWQPIKLMVTPNSTVSSVKTAIKTAYNADPTGVKSVFLLGAVPVPYSGNTAWDGHADHSGAWPADVYYADLDGNYTDATVNNVSPSRPENDNVPGDGKFDQNFVLTPAEISVGRVDFRHLTQATFGQTPAELIRRYLDKDHAWRTGSYLVEQKAVVDDNFGYFNGEAFAQSAFRVANQLVGAANIIEDDFFTTTATNKFLYAYGCGGGTYNSASGVGSSADFGTKTVNAVFTNIFGSYHGDWDFDVDPFMPAALASKGGILTCGWAGRPTFFQQTLTYGEPIGYAMKEVTNTRFNDYYIPVTTGEGGMHASLLGDPTIRTNIVVPIANLKTLQTCQSVEISWDASTEANLAGYLVYRATNKVGPYTRLTATPIQDTNYMDDNIAPDTYYYMVKVVKLTTTPGGGNYWNNSTGVLSKITINSVTPQTVSATGGTINCANLSVILQGFTNDPSPIVAWSGPNGYVSFANNPSVIVPGIYKYSVIGSNGCIAFANATVTQDIIAPNINAATSNNLDCAFANATLSVQPNLMITNYLWSGANNFMSTSATPTVSVAGSYSVIGTASNGCKDTAVVVVQSDFDKPIINIPPPQTITCAQATSTISATTIPANATFLWNNLATTSSITVSQSGIYTVTATNSANGCTQVSTAIVTSDLIPPISISLPNQKLTCANPCVILPSQIPGLPYLICWSGAGISPNCPPNPQVCAPGNYAAVVTNIGNGCTSSSNLIVESDGNVPDLTTTGGSLTCTSTSVTMTASSTVAGATFVWSSGSPTVMNAGMYSVTVTAPNGCTASQSVTVNLDIFAPVFTILAGAPITCTNFTTTFTVVNSFPATYLWNTNDTTATINWEVGDPIPSVTVTGTNGCSVFMDNLAVVVNNIPPTILLTQTVDCQGVTTVMPTVLGGAPPFSFQSSEATYPIISPNTVFTVTVTGANGCTAVASGVSGSPISGVGTSNPATFGSQNGTATVTVSGGTGPYLYSWNNGKTTATITNLTGGQTYLCTITDSKNCSIVISVFVDITSASSEPTVLATLILSPNPTSGVANLFLETKKRVNMSGEIRAIDGRLVTQLPDGEWISGNLAIDLSSEPSGVYFLQISLDGVILTRRLTVVK